MTITIHPRWIERFGIGSIVAYARQNGLALVQSGDKKRLFFCTRHSTEIMNHGNA